MDGLKNPSLKIHGLASKERINVPPRIHTLSFIRNAYKERFSWLVKFFEKIRNRLVIFLKIKEQTSLKIGKKHGFSSKIMFSLGYILVVKVRNG